MLCLFISRSKDIVEPMLKVQWYVKCEGMAQKAVEVLNHLLFIYRFIVQLNNFRKKNVCCKQFEFGFYTFIH